jgi:hypothetical protein
MIRNENTRAAADMNRKFRIWSIGGTIARRRGAVKKSGSSAPSLDFKSAPVIGSAKGKLGEDTALWDSPSKYL